MIKIERKQDSDSYFRNENVYDRIRNTEFKVSFLGITIYKNTEAFSCNIENAESKKAGFK